MFLYFCSINGSIYIRSTLDKSEENIFYNTCTFKCPFLARLHFSAEELLLYPRRQRRRPCQRPRRRRRRRPHAKC